MKKSMCKLVVASAFSLVSMGVWASEVAPKDVPPAAGESMLTALFLPVLVVVFGLLALWWVARRFAIAKGESGPLRVTQALAVGPRERVVLVHAGRKRLLVGVTSAQVSLLAQWEAGEEPEGMDFSGLDEGLTGRPS